jgi:hypothetical protein
MAERERGANWQCHSSPQPGISVTSDRQTLQPPAGPSAAGRQFAWRYQPDPLNVLDNSNADHKRASPANASEVDHVNGMRLPLDSEVHVPSQQQSPTASAALLQLATRLNFFKERRSQLMDQLNSLDPSLVPSSPSSHDLIPTPP